MFLASFSRLVILVLVEPTLTSSYLQSPSPSVHIPFLDDTPSIIGHRCLSLIAMWTPACSRGHQEGAPPRCEVSVWVDIELNQEDTSGLRR